MLVKKYLYSGLQKLNSSLEIHHIHHVLDRFAQPVSFCCLRPVRLTTATEPDEPSVKFEDEVSQDVIVSSFFSVEEVVSNLKLNESHSIPLEEEEESQDWVEETSCVWEGIEHSVVFQIDDS